MFYHLPGYEGVNFTINLLLCMIVHSGFGVKKEVVVAMFCD